MQHRNREQGQVAAETCPASARRQRDGGYLLLAIMLMMALMIIAATALAPREVQQMKRDREEEMIHRGTEYARAIKKFYKKNGRYPASLDDLDKGQIKYLRKRYKDPLTKDGKWRLLTYSDIATLTNATGPGTPAAALASQGGSGTLTPGGAMVPGGAAGGFGSQSAFGNQQQQQAQQPGGNTSGVSAPSSSGNQDPNIVSSSSQMGAQAGVADSGQGASGNQSSSSSSGFGQSSTTGSSPNSNSPFASNTTGGQTFGGGAIVGVASLSKDPTIRIYNKKKKYDEWMFIYNPMMDQQNVLLRGPYQPSTISNTQIGTPAGQMNGQQQNSPFGQQQQNGFGQQGGFGQQNTPQQPQSPGGNSPFGSSSQQQ